MRAAARWEGGGRGFRRPGREEAKEAGRAVPLCCVVCMMYDVYVCVLCVLLLFNSCKTLAQECRKDGQTAEKDPGNCMQLISLEWSCTIVPWT